MNIVLPQSFQYGDGHGNRAYVRDGTLFVEGDVSFEDLMYSLAYAVYGKKHCFYCGRKLNRNKVTLDHKYPRSWGGVSITNNLAPCCRGCNSKKSNMNAYQFKKWLTIPPEKRHNYYSKVVSKNARGMKKGFALPQSWITMLPVDEIARDIDFSEIKRMGNNKTNIFFQSNGCYPRPVIISSNGWVFKGFHILYHAKTHGIKRVYCIKLDNVVRVKKK